MWKQIQASFTQAIQSIRSNFFHTFLSILGIVIGVSALVAILSLIDGMEKYATDQISATTDLQNIIINSNTFKKVNGVRIAKDTFAYFDYRQFQGLDSLIKEDAQAYITTRQSSEIYAEGKEGSFGTIVNAIAPSLPSSLLNIELGRNLEHKDVLKQEKVTVLSHQLATTIQGDDDIASLLGKTITYKEDQLRVIGITEKAEGPLNRAQLHIPFTLFKEEQVKKRPPTVFINAHSVEDVPAIKTKIEDWIVQSFGDSKDDFSIMINDFRVDQVAKGFLLFRIVMGLIVGIAVLVGGIGVMNVLLISVTERTMEIGLRKAVGAKRKDIIVLFLSESILISLFGSMLGVILGILGTMVAIPIIKLFVDAPFQAAYTLNTLFVISVIAILIGIIFGTYPAMKAAKLDPVEAIRKE